MSQPNSCSYAKVSFQKNNNNEARCLNSSKANQVERALYNMDTNAYRSYKMSNDFKRNQSFTPDSSTLKNLFLSKLPLTDLIRKKYDPMKIPFGYKAKRFILQNNNSEIFNLNGTHRKYFPMKRNRSYVVKSLINRSETDNNYEKPKHIGESKAYNQLVLNNINTFRTIQPDKDMFSPIQPTFHSKRFLHRSQSTGSIKSLIDKTPTNPKIKTRLRNTKENGIFTQEFYKDTSFKRQKKTVDWKNIKKPGECIAGDIGIKGHGITGFHQFYSYYGPSSDADNLLSSSNNNYQRTDNQSNNILNYARRKKIMSNMSDIFNVKSNVNHCNGNRRQYTYCFEEEQKQ